MYCSHFGARLYLACFAGKANKVTVHTIFNISYTAQSVSHLVPTAAIIEMLLAVFSECQVKLPGPKLSLANVKMQQNEREAKHGT